MACNSQSRVRSSHQAAAVSRNDRSGVSDQSADQTGGEAVAQLAASPDGHRAGARRGAGRVGNNELTAIDGGALTISISTRPRQRELAGVGGIENQRDVVVAAGDSGAGGGANVSRSGARARAGACTIRCS